MGAIDIIIVGRDLEKYVDACLASCCSNLALQATIIFVDDGSVDSTQHQVERFASSHPAASIVVIQGGGHGAGAARNMALKRSSSEFVAFVDGDDLIDGRVLSDLVHKMRAVRADIAFPSVVVFDEGGRFTLEFDNPDMRKRVLRGRTACVTNIWDDPEIFDGETSMCFRVFRRKLIDRADISFQNLRFCEDVAPSRLALLSTSQVLIDSQVYYYYRQNRPGQATLGGSDGVLDIVSAIKTTIDHSLSRNLPSKSGGWLIHKLVRLGVWSLNIVRNGHLSAAVEGVDDQLRRVPPEWWSSLIADENSDVEIKSVARSYLCGPGSDARRTHLRATARRLI